MTELKNVSMIRAGTYFGECLTHCNTTLTITPNKIAFALTSNVPDPQHPDVVLERAITRKEWDELQTSVDWLKFRALPATIGQPDAADQGGAWVEITVDGERKRVDFEPNAAVPEFDALSRKLRELHSDFPTKP